MKKVIRFIAKFFLGLIAFLVLIFLFFWVRNFVFIGGVDAEDTAYLIHNRYDINRDSIAGDFNSEIFDNDFYNNQVFLLGENHGYADVQRIDKYMILHLHKKIGVRYYLAEMDTLRAGLLNEFLRKDQKDLPLLKRVISDIRLRIPQQSSQELYQKWFEVYDYNKGLPDSLKITVLGLDKNFDDYSTDINRDSAMVLNFIKTIKTKKLQAEKFYGFFGYTHVLQSGFGEKNIHPFAAKIKRSELPFAHKIQSIVTFTLESEMYMPKNDQYPSPPDERISAFNVDGPLVMVKGIKSLMEVTVKNSITLFNLNRSGSPYRESQRLAGIKVNIFGENILPNNNSQKTTDFFQYVILIRNSKALTKMD